MLRQLFAIALATTGLSACSHVDYDQVEPGTFEGSLTLLWVGESQRGLGDGTFVFVPNRTPLSFHRADPEATVEVITPQIMYTDGGSIPQLAQALNGFSPWGYAPAYMVHDWLFVARKCLNDNAATDAEQAIEGMTFRESARVAAEAIKTLIDEGKVQTNDVAPQAISNAVASGISHRLWRAKGACPENRIKPGHLAQIEAALPGTVDPKAFEVDKPPQPEPMILAAAPLPGTPQSIAPMPVAAVFAPVPRRVRPAQIITTFEFD